MRHGDSVTKPDYYYYYHTESTDTKFLGGILPANLNWTNMVKNKSSKCLDIISKVRHSIPLHLTRVLYQTLVRNQGPTLWNSLSLPKVIKLSQSLCIFKNCLRFYLNHAIVN